MTAAVRRPLPMSEDDLLQAVRDLAKLRGWSASKPALIISKVDMTGDCWLWTASVKENGYGQWNSGTRNYNAHRLIHEAVNGPTPPGLELDHLCRVRRCVRPSHLEAVTRAENRRRQFAVITHCPAGHRYTAENTAYSSSSGYACRSCRTCRTVRNRNRSKGAAA